MLGSVSAERVVKVPASEAWKVYGSLRLAELVEKDLPSYATKIEVLEGDGGAGTKLEIHLAAGAYGEMKSLKEVFAVVDDEQRVKVSEVVEGGFLDMGFTVYRFRVEIIEEAEERCITRATVEYELGEESAANAALVTIQPLVDIMQLANDYLERNNNNNNSN